MTMPFQIGDLVFHSRLGETDEDDDRLVGHLTGFAPNRNWLRVKTLDGKWHIWARRNVVNCDYTCREGNYAGR